jgi:hypothetical protein
MEGDAYKTNRQLEGVETGQQQSISSRPRSHPWIMPKRFGSIAAQLPPANILCQVDFPQIASIAPFVTFPKRITVLICQPTACQNVLGFLLTLPVANVQCHFSTGEW